MQNGKNQFDSLGPNANYKNQTQWWRRIAGVVVVVDGGVSGFSGGGAALLQSHVTSSLSENLIKMTSFVFVV